MLLLVHTGYITLRVSLVFCPLKLRCC